MTTLSVTDQFPDIWQRLYAMKARNRIAHAYLITGDNESLLEAAARHWGQTITCLTHVDGKPCQACKACTSFATGAYREWYELRPQSKSRRILVEDMRDFEHQLSLTAAAGFRKIGAVIEADRLNDQAQNAFLKTLEEPPGDVVLLLVTTHPQQLLATIRSRCQLISLRLNRREYDILDKADILPALKPMKRGAGAAVALHSAARLKQAFGNLMKIAEDNEPEFSAELEAMANQDPALKKRLEEQRDVRILSEYIRLRTQLCGVVETWFQQRCTCLANGEGTARPNPELSPGNDDLKGALFIEAQADAVEAMKLTRFLAGNMDENLALEAFCLTVCKKRS